jgi:peptidoglycan hydrolase CwlO-like protein
MNENMITVLVSAVVSVFTGLIGFATGRKKSLAEADSTTIDNVEKALAIYKDIIDDMKARYDKEIADLKSKLIDYEKNITQLEQKIKSFKQ